MQTFNKAALDEIIDRYARQLEVIRDDEVYKWEAVYCFQQHWNPEAENFADMLKASLAKASNLLVGAMYYPAGMLYEFAEFDSDKTRRALVDLLESTNSLDERLADFSETMAQINDSLNEQKKENDIALGQNHYQDPRAACVYLAFAHPEKYYLYKSEMYRKFAKRIDAEVPKGKFKKPVAYMELCDEVLKVLEAERPGLIDSNNSLLAPEYRNIDSKYHLLVQDIIYFATAYDQNEGPQLDQAGTNAWVFAPGEDAWLWDEFQQLGIMGMGWDELGDFSDYDSQAEIAERLRELEETDSSKTNDSLACWQFLHDMQPGDVVYVKQGMSKILGRGIVKSDYRFEDSREFFKHVRDVEWTHAGEWNAPYKMARKTLTGLSGYDKERQLLEGLFSTTAPDITNCNYWWLVANPKIWSFGDIEIGEEQNYTLRNENGNPRRIQKHFLEAKPGDLVYGYESSPTLKVVALCEISKDHDDERMYFRKVRDLQEPISYKELQENEALSNLEFMLNYSGSLFAVTPEEHEVLQSMIGEEDVPIERKEFPAYTDQDFLAEVFLRQEDLSEMKELLRRKKNLILQGAPGTGKTFAAKRLAYAMMGAADTSRVQMVQFHQNSAYDDFVYGYRPNDAGGFDVVPGTFVEFCRKAVARPAEEFFFVIDEINRANISKVLGELLMLIEADHREESITLPVSGERFAVPGNLYIIGMMNTADRGLALIDYALRRRFAFFEMEPALTHQKFREAAAKGGDGVESLVDAVIGLNETIAADPALGRGFRIGHSYFCVGDNASADIAESIIKYELRPLIEEYWFDNPTKAEGEIGKLEDAVR